MNSIYNNLINKNNNNKEDYEIEINSYNNPKNSGKIWTDKERTKILKILNKEDQIDNIFTDKIIYTIAEKLERTSNSILSEIKKTIIKDFFNGNDINNISKKFNINEENINLIIKISSDDEINKQCLFFKKQNKLLRLKLENIKLRKELKELQENIE